MNTDIGGRFLERSRHYLCVEYPAKITAALHSMPTDRVWWRPNESSNSAGNLVLHLHGNVRQWVVSGIGGAPDSRTRDAEFAARDGADATSLVRTLHSTIADVDTVLKRLTPAMLQDARVIQGRTTTIFSALYHVVEHFSGHTGQIILLAKLFTPGAVQFYDDAGGLARPLFLNEGEHDID